MLGQKFGTRSWPAASTSFRRALSRHVKAPGPLLRRRQSVPVDLRQWRQTLGVRCTASAAGSGRWDWARPLRAGTSLARARELAAEARTALGCRPRPPRGPSGAHSAGRAALSPAFGEMRSTPMSRRTGRAGAMRSIVAQWRMAVTTHCAPIRADARRRGRHRSGAEGVAAALGATARDRQAPPGADRESPRCSRRSRLQDE